MPQSLRRPDSLTSASTPRVVAWTLIVGITATALELGLVWGGRGFLDARQFVTADRLTVALQTFRPSERAGLAREVPVADLAPDLSVRSDPAACAPLVLLGTGAPIGAGSWSGVNGSPVQPVSTLTVRYPTAAAARRVLGDKRAALRHCSAVRLTFPPFDEPEQPFTVRGRRAGLVLVGSTLAYRLEGSGKGYAFYVRRWGNTLSWTYGDAADPPRPRRQVVDDLADRLAELAGE